MANREVFIVGHGLTKFGEHYHKNPSSLASQALIEAIKNSHLEKESIQSVFLGSLVTNTNSQSSVGSNCLRECNLTIPFTRIEAGTASGAAAFQQAYVAIKSGLFDCVAVVGVENLSDFVKNSTIEKILGTTIDYSWEFEMGATLTSLYAILTKAHMQEYKTTMEQLASVPEKNHKNGAYNKKAQFQKEIPLERFLKAKRISEPIGRFDPATHCDGSGAIILASSDFVEKNLKPGYLTRVLGIGSASDYLALQHREQLTTLKATKIAAKNAYAMAGISSTDVNVAEVHDSYPIGEILAIEDLDLFPKGEGGSATETGKTKINGEVSVNTSGGLKARGDPFGATGLAQIIEIIDQLDGKADQRQVDDIKYGLTQNVSGTGAMSYVNIFAKEEVKQ
ncbi:MAG: thiolase domain-containing protein [Candidatus Heimdallarchaeota archaeon]|nr:thiolase domain-containing protein [Candidatus Heimdallarchaeota archaeon]